MGAVKVDSRIMPAKRSNPKTLHRAGELRRELTPAERKLMNDIAGVIRAIEYPLEEE